MVLMGMVVGVPAYVQAQGQPGVGVVTTLVGEATVARSVAARPENLRMRDHVFALDRISTKERSMVHVLMGGKALLTVRELSVVTVTEEGGRATIDLQSGKVGLAVVRERMQPGDVIEVQTPHAVAAVRGTVLVVEIVPGPPGGDQLDSSGESTTDVHLLHGKLDVSLRSDPGGVPVRLETLQTVTVSRAVLGKIRPLDLATATAVTNGLKPSRQVVTAIPEKLQTEVDERQGVLAAATAAELARGGQSRESGKGLGAKTAPTAVVTAGDGGSTLDAIIPVAEVEDGLNGSIFGVVDGSVSSLGGSGTSDSGGSGVGATVGATLSGSGGSSLGSGGGVLGSSGPGSGSGSGGKGPSLGSGGSSAGSILAPVTGLPLFKKK